MPHPKLTLANDRVKMVVYLPDAKTGRYRGPRFDWSGMIARVAYSGHTFFGEPVREGSAEYRYSAVGPAEEFRARGHRSFDEAGPGEPFVKIGVGLLARPDERDYSIYVQYNIVRPGEWKIDSGKDWIAFQQDLTGPRGWAYSYTKRITLTDDGPGFTLWHCLKNTGSKTIDTFHYNHNFIIIDDTASYPNITVKLAFAAPTPQPIKDGDTQTKTYAEFRGNKITFLKRPPEWLLAELKGLRNSVEDSCVLVENAKTGAAVRIEGDLPIEKFVFYATDIVVSPEPYVHIKLAPGAEKQWTLKYTFLVGETKSP